MFIQNLFSKASSTFVRPILQNFRLANHPFLLVLHDLRHELRFLKFSSKFQGWFILFGYQCSRLFRCPLACLAPCFRPPASATACIYYHDHFLLSTTFFIYFQIVVVTCGNHAFCSHLFLSAVYLYHNGFYFSSGNFNLFFFFIHIIKKILQLVHISGFCLRIFFFIS